MRKNDGRRRLRRCWLVHEAQHSHDVLWWAHVPVLVSTRWPIFLQTLWTKGPAINAGSKAGPPAGYADDKSVAAVEVNSVSTGTEDKSGKGVDNMHIGVQNLHFSQHLFLKLYRLKQQWTRNKVWNEWSLKQPLGLFKSLKSLYYPTAEMHKIESNKIFVWSNIEGKEKCKAENPNSEGKIKLYDGTCFIYKSNCEAVGEDDNCAENGCNCHRRKEMVSKLMLL